jgi:hypothetical protein
MDLGFDQSDGGGKVQNGETVSAAVLRIDEEIRGAALFIRVSEKCA